MTTALLAAFVAVPAAFLLGMAFQRVLWRVPMARMCRLIERLKEQRDNLLIRHAVRPPRWPEVPADAN